jgi:hypothetical protein
MCMHITYLYERYVCNMFQISKKKVQIAIAGDEEHDENLSVELTALLTLLNKDLNSNLVPLRQVSHSCYVLIARAVIGGDSDRAKGVLAQSIETLFTDYSGKKNSRIPAKLFDDLVQRFPDFAVSALLRQLVHACVNAKTAYLRADSCRLLGELLKRYKALSEPSQTSVQGHTGDIVASIVSTLRPQSSANLAGKDSKAAATATTTTSAAAAMPTKRVKNVLTYAKEVVHFVKAHPNVVTGKMVKSLDQLKGVLQEHVTVSASPVVTRLAEQLIETITSSKFVAATPSSSVSSSASTAKGKNKGKDIEVESRHLQSGDSNGDKKQKRLASIAAAPEPSLSKRTTTDDNSVGDANTGGKKKPKKEKRPKSDS